MTGKDRDFGLGTSLALTLGSALLWGVAHLAAHRHRTGLALMAAHVFLLAFILTMATVFSTHLLSLAVQPRWITALVVTLTVLAATWTAVIVRSYTLVRPAGCGIAGRALTTGLTIGLCALVLAPTAYAARLRLPVARRDAPPVRRATPSPGHVRGPVERRPARQLPARRRATPPRPARGAHRQHDRRQRGHRDRRHDPVRPAA